MKFQIHGTLPDGSEDSFVVQGDTIEEVRQQAQLKASAMQMTDCWSVDLEEK